MGGQIGTSYLPFSERIASEIMRTGCAGLADSGSLTAHIVIDDCCSVHGLEEDVCNSADVDSKYLLLDALVYL